MKLSRNFEYLSITILVLISLFLLSSPYLLRGRGVRVVSISGVCEDVLTPGSIITEVAGYQISDEEQFYSLIKKLKGPTTFVINYNPRSCYIPEDKPLNITVTSLRKSALRLGIDLVGGVRYVYEPQETSESILKETLWKLKERKKSWELANTEIRSFDGKIEIVTGKDEEEYLPFLTKKGEVEGGFVFNVELENDKGKFDFNEKTYEIERVDDKIKINGITREVNEKFMLDSVEFYVKNVSSTGTFLIGKVFNERDLKLVESRLNPTRLMRQRGGYVFVVYTSLSENASRNFKKLTISQEVNVNPLTGESLLANPLVVFVDGEEIMKVPINGKNKGLEVKELALWSFETNKEEAVRKMILLSSLIKSGKLPTDLILQEKEHYEVKDGKSLFLIPCSLFLLFSIVSPLSLMKKYKRDSLIVPLLILCSIIIFFGILSFPALIVLVFMLGLIISFRKEWLSGWLSVLTIFFLFVSMIGILMKRLILGVASIYGLATFIIYSFISLIIIGLKLRRGEMKKVYENLWKSNLIFAVIFMCLFFIGGSLTEFSTSFLINFIFFTTIIIPLFLEKFKKV